MKEHGILFSAPMVKAFLARRKTQTRRMSKQWLRVKAGDVLWVRENWWKIPEPSFQQLRDGADTWPKVAYDADESDICREQNRVMGWKLKPSIHMPRWASRITLIATEDAREEQLQDITEADAIAEGAEITDDLTGAAEDLNGSYVAAYRILWDSLHGKDAPWASNPSVVRLAFKIAQIPDFDPAAPKGAKSIG